MKKPYATGFPEIYSEFDPELEGFDSEGAEAWQGEVNRKSGDYIRWVQRSLNRIMGLQLAVDGIIGSQTRSAIRGFQQQQRLTVDGIVGSQTEAALIAAGASSPPSADAGVVGSTTGSASSAPSSSATTRDMPLGPFGTLIATTPKQARFSYSFTPEDVLWTARFIVGEAGGRDDAENRAVIWAMFNRYAFFTHGVYPTFHQFIRAYSTPLQPVLKSWGAAKRHMHKSEFVRTGGNYAPPHDNIPRGQLRGFLELQAKLWRQLSAGARTLAEQALRGQVPNPIGNASEFGSTNVYFHDKYGRYPNDDEWRRYTETYAQRKNKPWIWIGAVPNLNQKKNAFFIDRRAASLPPNSVRVVSAAATNGASRNFESTLLEVVMSEIDVDRAVALNRSYANSLGWQTYFDRIVQLVGFTNFTPDESAFAEAVARWQRANGLTDDGIIGPKTWAKMQTALGLAVSQGVNTPLPLSGVGYHSYNKSTPKQYGLPDTIRALQAIGAAWYHAHPQGPRIGIGDLSLQGGGPMSPHVSHQKGVDVDIRPMRNDRREDPVVYQSPSYSRSLTQELVNLIRGNGILRVQYIFFNDPQVTGVSDQSGHDNHLHVRFFLPPAVTPPQSGALVISSRAEWGARPPRETQALRLPVGYAFIHHTAGSMPTTPEAERNTMRSIQNYHQNEKGWADIAYNFVIFPSGRIAQGRGWNTVGAATYNWNSRSLSFCFAGNYETSQPAQQSLNACRALLAEALRQRYLTSDFILRGHRDVSSTACPGSYLYPQLYRLDPRR